MKRTELDKLENIDPELAEKLSQLCPPLDSAASEKLLKRVQKGLEADFGFEYEPETTVTGADPYQKQSWKRFASAAAAVLVIAGLCGAGGLILGKKGGSAPGKEPSAAVSDESTGYTATSSASTDSTLEDTSAPASEHTTETHASSEKKKTAYEPKGTKLLTLDEMVQLSKKGASLTLGDFSDYIFEDVGTSINVLKYYMPEDFTLLIGCEPDKDKVYFMDLIKGNRNGSGEHFNAGESIDIRKGGVEDYINRAAEADRLNAQIQSLTPESIRTAKVSQVSYVSTDSSGNNAKSDTEIVLSEEQVKKLISLMKKIKLEMMSKPKDDMYYYSVNELKLTLTDGSELSICDLNDRLMFNYLLTDNYKIHDESYGFRNYLYEIISEATPVHYSVVSDSAICWFDLIRNTSVPYRSRTEITVDELPGFTLVYDLDSSTVSVFKEGTSDEYASFCNVINAYFIDMNGDGHPELCMTYTAKNESSGKSEMRAAVYDVFSGMKYELSGNGQFDYWLYIRDDKLSVFEDKPDDAPFSGNGRTGYPVISEGRLTVSSRRESGTFKIVSVQDDNVIVEPIDRTIYALSNTFVISRRLFTDIAPIEGRIIEVTYNELDISKSPAQFTDIDNIRAAG